jgi:methionine sulfoxide reductase heme-binding subunit
MRAPDPTQYLWWLVSRASGVVALGLVTLSVLIGLTMASKLLRRPGLGKRLVKLHEHTALAGLIVIGVHGVTLLGDKWLHPGVRGIVVPFAMGYRPLFTGLGIIAGYVAALLGLSFYLRRRIGTRLWRRLHRATVLVYALGVVHALGSGTDAVSTWLRVPILASAVPVVALFVARVIPRRRRAVARGRGHAPSASRPTALASRPTARASRPTALAVEESA